MLVGPRTSTRSSSTMSASALPLTASQASDPGYQGKYRGCVWKEGPRCIITIMDGERVWKECVWVADKPEHVKFNAFDTGTFRVLELDFKKRGVSSMCRTIQIMMRATDSIGGLMRQRLGNQPGIMARNILRCRAAHSRVRVVWHFVCTVLLHLMCTLNLNVRTVSCT